VCENARTNLLKSYAQPKSIYVEIDIAADLEVVWATTQTPELHERWDLRFNEIKYLPKAGNEPQRFLYSTRIGFGLKIEGEGQSIAEKTSSDGPTSALRSWSVDSKSLILKGSGYWQYRPIELGTKFLTGYNYETRFGPIGMGFDRVFFRPLIRWATAWSFDTLRLWLEKGVPPEASRDRAAIHLAARLALAFVWVYQGLVPKLLFSETGELAIMRRAHLPGASPETWLALLGSAEVLFGIVIVVFWRSKGIIRLQMATLVAFTLAAWRSYPRMFVEPSNPVSLNMLLLILSAIVLVADRDLPSAHNCKRNKPTEPE